MENSGTALAIRGKDGVVFAVEKIVTSKLYEEGANRRIFNIDTHIGMAAAGLVTDARQLASIARDEVRIVIHRSLKIDNMSHMIISRPAAIARTTAPPCPSPSSSRECPATCTPTPSTAASGPSESPP